MNERGECNSKNELWIVVTGRTWGMGRAGDRYIRVG